MQRKANDIWFFASLDLILCDNLITGLEQYLNIWKVRGFQWIIIISTYAFYWKIGFYDFETDQSRNITERVRVKTTQVHLWQYSVFQSGTTYERFHVFPFIISLFHKMLCALIVHKFTDFSHFPCVLCSINLFSFHHLTILFFFSEE